MSIGLPGSKVRIALGGRSESRRGQCRSAVEGDLVLVEAPGLEAFDVDERVVVAADAEGLLAAAEHLDLATFARLDPDSRLGFRDVAEQGAEQEIWHLLLLPGSRGFHAAAIVEFLTQERLERRWT